MGVCAREILGIACRCCERRDFDFQECLGDVGAAPRTNDRENHDLSPQCPRRVACFAKIGIFSSLERWQRVGALAGAAKSFRHRLEKYKDGWGSSLRLWRGRWIKMQPDVNLQRPAR